MIKFNRRRVLAYIAAGVCLVTITGAFVVMVFIASGTNNKLTSDEHATCLIQQRGLKAGHALVATISDLNKLLSEPQTKAAKARAAKTPPAELALIANLRTESGRYVQIEAKQPATRHCG